MKLVRCPKCEPSLATWVRPIAADLWCQEHGVIPLDPARPTKQEGKDA